MQGTPAPFTAHHTPPLRCPKVPHSFRALLLLCVPQVKMPRARGLASRPKKKKPEWLADLASEEPETTEKIDGARDEGSSPRRALRNWRSCRRSRLEQSSVGRLQGPSTTR